MDAITLCPELLRVAIDDNEIMHTVLYKILAHRSPYLAIDRNGDSGMILQKYREVISDQDNNGEVQKWLYNMLKQWLFKMYKISKDDISDEYELFARICNATKSKTILCEDRSYYDSCDTKYPDMEFMDRQSLRKDPGIFEEVMKLCENGRNQIKILFLASEPTDQGRTEAGVEHREIDQRLKLANLRDHFILEECFAVRPEDLSGALLEKEANVAHFCGHGLSSGELIIQDSRGISKIISSFTLDKLFSKFKDTLRCVVLNSCFSVGQATIIAKHIDYVIGMRNTISNDAAIAFSLGFYQALGSGRNIEDAVDFGRIQIGLQGYEGSDDVELIVRTS